MRALLIATLLFAAERAAEACGCFVPPDGTVPVVQAGERILFAREGGDVVAHIQIQFAGAASDFGWLLPLPSLPELQLGTDELFTRVLAATQPKYLLPAPEFDDCDSGGGDYSGCGGSADTGDESGLPRPFPGPDAANGTAVFQDSIGPYDYAVLRADSKTEMLDWLAQNRYFVPAGTDDVVTPYIRPNAYFLALKLRPGKSTGDLQPVVVRYASDLPMIPIVLTSVAAQPDMGISVFMLGRGRAIPRNYAHTVLNDAAIDWVGGARNYNDVVIRATREARERHTFITEYAGPSSIMAGSFGNATRYGTLEGLASRQGIDELLTYLEQTGYLGPGGYPSQVVAILSSYAPMPPELAQLGMTPARFYRSLASWRTTYPTILQSWHPKYDAQALAAELWERFVMPVRAVAKLFDDHPYLTRLYTTLSPGDMTVDPVFSENGKLPPVSNVHNGRLIYRCMGAPLAFDTPVEVITEQGRHIYYPDGLRDAQPFTTPGSLRIETLAEEGDPQTMVDNSRAIADTLPRSDLPQADGSACALGRGPRAFSAALLLLLIGARLWRNRRPSAARR